MDSKSFEDHIIAKRLNVQNKLEIGGVEVTSSAAELNKLDGATATVAELNTLHGEPAAVGFSVGTEAADVIKVTIQLKDADGADLAVRGSLFGYLSDDANGDSIVASAPSGGWAIATDGLLIPLIASKAAQFVSEADGDIDVNITHATTSKTVYLVFVLPNGKLAVSPAITFAA